ncbi:MAG: hypothetical protein KBS58_02880 [Bacteroidales bacterium]|nr:hypothetical protein [Candidatus Cacconaster equi]
MKFREIVDSPCGLRFCFESLELSSGFARKTLLDKEMMTDEKAVSAAYDTLRVYADLVGKERRLVENVQFKLCGLREISGTLSSLKDGNVLDDIELFEIKHLAMLGSDVRTDLKYLDIPGIDIEYDKIIDILDPDGLRIGTFYIYDTYSQELRDARRRLEADPDNEELKDDVMTLEDGIKQNLSEMLRPWAADLENLMSALADVDINISKALLMYKEHYVIPEIGDRSMIKGMFHPEVKALLEKRNRTFQCIDFDFRKGSTSTVIGANMGGKTVAMKTLCLMQYLFQFGFAVPAAKAVLEVYDIIQFCIGDEQSEKKGLSSFAAEILRINNVIVSAGTGKRLLALIDEPARTTNPVEGSALVSALLKILNGKENLALILTTHYKVDYAGQCWKVKGLVGGSAGLRMDYELVKTDTNDVPQEALNIARELHINDLWINEAAMILGRM